MCVSQLCLYKRKIWSKSDITNCGSISSPRELNVSDEFLINHIRDLLSMREQPHHSILSSDEIKTLLEYFCCNATIVNLYVYPVYHV